MSAVPSRPQVAYSPLCQGLLTGKYAVSGAKPSGPRGAIFSDARIREVQPLLDCMSAIAQPRGKTLAQVRKIVDDVDTALL